MVFGFLFRSFVTSSLLFIQMLHLIFRIRSRHDVLDSNPSRSSATREFLELVNLALEMFWLHRGLIKETFA